MRSGPTRLDKNSFGQPTSLGRIDGAARLSTQWFPNRQVSSVLTPSLTRAQGVWLATGKAPRWGSMSAAVRVY